MNKVRSQIQVALAAVSVGIGLAGSVFAADNTWTGNGDGKSWNQSGNWSLGSVPSASDNAIFSKSATITDTIAADGRVTVQNGAVVTVTDTVLGGSAGSSARLVVTGQGSKFDSLNLTIGGASGGTGKVVTEQGGVLVVAKTYSSTAAYCLTVAKGAVPAEGDMIDVLEIGPGQSSVAYLNNLSSYPARITFTDASSTLRLATASSNTYQEQFKSGNWVLKADDPAVMNISLPPYGYFTYWWPLKVEGTGAFKVGGTTSGPYYCRLNLLNEGGFTVLSSQTLKFEAGRVDMQEMRGPLTVAGSLNCNGNAIYADGLEVSGTLTATEADSFTFGSGDRNGTLSAAIPAASRVAKVGSGMLSVTGTSSAGTVTVSNGTLKVGAAFAVQSLVLEAGTTLLIDGVEFAPGQLVQNGTCNIQTANGGRLVYGSDSSVEFVRPNMTGDITKMGTGRMTMYDPVAIPSRVVVSGGTLAFSKYGRPERYWRWTFKKLSGDAPSALSGLAQMWLFAPDGSRIAKNSMEKVPWAYTPNKDLSASDSYKGKMTWRCDPDTTITSHSDSWQNAYDQLGKLFQSSASENNNFPRLVAPLIDNADPKTYVGLEFRLHDEDAAVTGYNIGVTTTGVGRPTDWTVEASDDGKTWTTVENRENVTLPPNTYAIFYDGTTYDRSKGFAEDFRPAETFHFTDYIVNGLTASLQPIAAQVDKDATLNLSAFTGGQPLNALTYDASKGGGTVVNASIVENGALYYVGEMPKGGFELPYTFADCANMNAVSTWNVYQNGKLTHKRLKAKDGKVFMTVPGLILVVR